MSLVVTNEGTPLIELWVPVADDGETIVVTAGDDDIELEIAADVAVHEATLAAHPGLRFPFGQGPILTAPDATLHRLKVANDGSLSTEAV